ncbi:MAG: type I restriction endonuclease [Jaaginema sp. PMC 1079.18]|nr:type I restriction endonuclease [Jaaginema sp. PMC 1080.18]MEC4849645.1 type I restriction endonuclease [Jaaginema sp. PMC 1079.18]MEC4864689.1 type I restriction endonuclease [Jaaginema sp. PMC 1078.18]
MIQSISAQDVTLRLLQQKFALQSTQDSQFFPEWSVTYPQLDNTEKERLDRVKGNFLALLENPPLLENSVKMVVLAPLLDLAGFYRPPFHLETEASITLEMVDEETTIKGRIDILVEKNKLWLLVIESKRSDFAVSRAIPQALAYMLSNPQNNTPTFGAISNGNEFLFLKAVRQPTAKYANSRLFSLLNPGNDLYAVLQILKGIGQVIT